MEKVERHDSRMASSPLLRQKLRGQVSGLKDELKGTKREQADKQKEVRGRGGRDDWK